MAAAEPEASRARHMQCLTDEEEEEDGEIGEAETTEEEEEEEEGGEKNWTKSIFLIMCGSGSGRSGWFSVQVLDPRARWVQDWNRVFLLVCAAGLFVDPLFFYALSVSDRYMCLFVDGWLAVVVTALRCMTDALHLWNMWLQFKMDQRTRRGRGGDRAGSDGGGGRSRVALRRLTAKKGFFFDLFVILPLPQGILFGGEQAAGDA